MNGTNALRALLALCHKHKPLSSNTIFPSYVTVKLKDLWILQARGRRFLFPYTYINKFDSNSLILLGTITFLHLIEP